MDKILNRFKAGDSVMATDIAKISGHNQVKGIHPIMDDAGNIECVAILCTINGENYANKWVDNNILKYYFFGPKQNNGMKKFSPEYAGNKEIIASKNKYPIYAFVRNKKNERFIFEGKFELLSTSTEADGAMYFLLKKEGTYTCDITQIPVEDNENFPEGKEKERLHKYKERNPEVIKRAKNKFQVDHGRVFCEVCGFDFEAVYGEIGADYIEGHHTIPVSELTEEGITNVDDILLVCANCHRMLHRRRPCLTREELSDFIRR